MSIPKLYLPALALALCLPLACDKTSDKKADAPSGEAKADDDKPADDAEPAAEDTKPDDDGEQAAAAPEGYQSHLLAALGELSSGAAISQAEVKPYGCSVKYAGDGEEPAAKVGEPAPAFTLPDLDGNEVSLADFSGKTVVIEWFNPDCPFVKYAHEPGGPLATLAKEQTEAGVVWIAINSGAAGKQGAGAERNKKAASDWGLDHPILIDEDGEVGHLYGAKTTPHMYVIDPEGKLVYAGALDNAPLGEVKS